MTQKNIVVQVPSFADGVFEDAKGNVTYIKGETIDLAGLQGLTKVGQVLRVDGKKVTVIANTESGGLKYTEGALWYLTNVNLGGDTLTLQNRPASGSATALTFTYGAQQSLAAFAQALDTFLRTNDPNAIDWHCEYMSTYTHDAEGNEVFAPVIIIDKWSADNQNSTPVSAGCTATLFPSATMQPSYGSTPCVGGFSGSYPSANIEVYKATTQKRTPTSNEAWNNTLWDGPVTEGAFNTSQYCQALRDRYKNYEEYLLSRFVSLPAARGAVGITQEQCIEYAQRLGDRQHKKKNGTLTYTYPAHHYAKAKGVEWGQMSVENQAILMKDILYCSNATWRANNPKLTTDRTADKINHTRYLMGGTVVNTAGSRWCGVRGNANRAWSWNGNSGYLYSDNRFFLAFAVCPARFYKLP